MSKIFVLIGSSSELSNSFKEILLRKNEKFISISRAKDANITVKDYFLESEEIVKKLKAYKNLNIIFFNGYLAENRPFQIPNHNDVVKTDYINFTVPYSLTEKFISNDLDVETLHALEYALEKFSGSALIISHDRWFLDRMATHILAFEGNSHLEWFEGNYSDYLIDYKRRYGESAEIPSRIKYKKFSR